MSVRGRGDDDLVDAPFADDAERAEADWLLARELDPAARAPSAKIANEYAELEDLLGNLPEAPLDDSWQDAVSRIGASSAPSVRPWWWRAPARWAAGGAFVAASAAAAWLLIPPAPAELEVAIRPVDPTRGDPERSNPERGEKVAAIGDLLIVTARPHESADLRVYRSEGTLLARCPGGRGCIASPAGGYTIEVTLDAPGQYQVILVVGAIQATPGDTMDAYLEAARAANARIVTYQPIDVR